MTERRIILSKYEHVWGKAIKARDSVLDSVTAEVTGKKPAMRRAGRLQATHDYDEYRAAATPRLVAEMASDLDYAVRRLNYYENKEDRKLPKFFRVLGWVIYGTFMFTLGQVFHQWWVS